MSIKDIVKQIKKLAQMPEVPILNHTLPSGVVSPHNSFKSRRGVFSPAVKEMQLAMQHLSQVISSSIQYDKMTAALEGKKPESQDELQGQYGKDAFSNFMVNTYVRNSPIKGTELDPSKQHLQDKNPSELKNMYIILDNMRKIGATKGEDFADGDWGPRTNNALKNIVAIGSAVINLGADLGMNFGEFDPEELVQLSNPDLIPENEKNFDVKQKEQRAPYITKILRDITSLFTQFKAQVLNNPAYSNIINGKAPVLTLNKQEDGAKNMQGEEKAIFADLKTNGNKSQFANSFNTFHITIPTQLIHNVKATGNNEPIAISAADLVSSAAFNNWIAQNKLLSDIKNSNPPSWQQIIMTILDQVKQQVAAKLKAS